ncbi:hypothetical protein SPBR_08030 [Sporothrix brasiliensis 5110]|uniref:Uncharacterized protein n=1 Tax=Sporothrix brasiliensis 5110 TaxID=1398154 RepID=A0A0C2IHE3_9PEZI|nr:uncharacterized protein SPBR_08030 [Sporothrix brasiliensis 5110]KIH88606.1 hypothetical protein SPBR_08030 [Sporothrix brasiliensis 5110]
MEEGTLAHERGEEAATHAKNKDDGRRRLSDGRSYTKSEQGGSDGTGGRVPVLGSGGWQGSGWQTMEVVRPFWPHFPFQMQCAA